MFKKTKIAAVTAAVLGLSAAGFMSTAQAVSVDESGATGQVLVFPYYNVNNGFSTSFHITNTTSDYKAIKVRFRESKTSNDVLDFNLYMSPYDVFTMGLTKGADGKVWLSTADNSCTFPSIADEPNRSVELRDVYDSVEAADLAEGYLEVIEMGVVMGDATVEVKGKNKLIANDGIVHEGDTPKNCDLIRIAWEEGQFIQGGARSNGGDTDDIHTVHPNPPTIYSNWDKEKKYKKSDKGWYGSDSTKWDEDNGALTAPTGGLAGSSIIIDVVKAAAFVVEPVSIAHYSDVPQHYLSADFNFYLLPSLASGSGWNNTSANAKANEGTQHSKDVSDDFSSIKSVGWDFVARDYGLDDRNLAPNSYVPSGINPMPISHAMAVTKLSNQYFLLDGAETDWVVSAPMKKHGIYNGYEYVAPDAGYGGYKTTGSGAFIPENAHIIGLTKDDTSDQAKIDRANKNGVWVEVNGGSEKDLNSPSFFFYDQEERKDVASPTTGRFSPPVQVAPGNTTFPFPREVNIISLSTAEDHDVNMSKVLGSESKQGYSFPSGFKMGWGSFTFDHYDLAHARYTDAWTTAYPVAGALTKGAPVQGFAAASGDVNGGTIGETFPHIIGRMRGN